MLIEKRGLTQAETYKRLTAEQQRVLEEWVAKYNCEPIFYSTGSCVYAELECAPDLHARKYFTTHPRERVEA